jgi:flavin reductase (DIM6/NTAB) family NADH-FMN oxidoreductase RutF
MHMNVEPSILYFGTPVVLLSSLNDDGSPNIAPMSSVWWLGWNCMLGLGGKGHTAQNLLREKECVLNLPATDLAENVNKLARLTGALPVPPHKQMMGYRYEKDKFGVAGLTPTPSELVKPPRIAQCPIQLEAFEMRIVRAHIDDSLLVPGKNDHIDPDKWRPLIMSFCQFYGLGEKVGYSTLAEIPEEAYRPVPRMQR